MDCSLPGYFGHGSILARILEWAAISFSRGSSQPRDGSWVSCIGRQIFFFFLTTEPPQWGLYNTSHLLSALQRVSFSFFIIFYWIFEYIQCIQLFLKKKKELCSSVKSFIFLEIVHSLRPMLSFFVWRISSTPQVCLRLSASLRHRWLLLLGGRAPHRPLLVSPGSGNCPLPALSGLRVGVGRRHFVIAVAPAYCTNLWLPTFCLRFVHLSVWDSPLNT